MPISITNVLNKIGVENVRLQFVSNSLVSFREKKADLEITIATEKSNKPLPNNDKIGIVLWVSKKAYNKAILELEAEKDAQ